MEIKNILNGVKDLSMVVPEFQREYVWSFIRLLYCIAYWFIANNSLFSGLS